MITKERLEELIEQGATIYRAYADICVEEFKLNKDYKVSTAHLWKKMKHSAFKGCGYPLDQLFETHIDAEEYAEFGNVTRTERLELPSWEEFNKVSTFEFKRKDGIYMEIAIWSNCSDDTKTIKITHLNDWNICFFSKPLTRENYNEARRLCVKLFKGEDDG